MKQLAALVGFMNFLCFGQVPGLAADQYRSPTLFEEAILQFEAQDKEDPPPHGAIVCGGSSSIRGWHQTIKADLAPLTIIPRGLGGSNMNDALHYADRIVLPYRPRAIVIYEGGNDITQGISPRKIADTFNAFVAKVHETLPDCRIYFLSIKPSIKHWNQWSIAKEANRLIAEECARGEKLLYVDVASGMLGDDGKPREAIFQEDKLHMTREGYLLWRGTLRPILISRELQFVESSPGE